MITGIHLPTFQHMAKKYTKVGITLAIETIQLNLHLTVIALLAAPRGPAELLSSDSLVLK